MWTRSLLKVWKALFSSTLSWRHQNDYLESGFLEDWDENSCVCDWWRDCYWEKPIRKWGRQDRAGEVKQKCDVWSLAPAWSHGGTIKHGLYCSDCPILRQEYWVFIPLNQLVIDLEYNLPVILRWGGSHLNCIKYKLCLYCTALNYFLWWNWRIKVNNTFPWVNSQLPPIYLAAAHELDLEALLPIEHKFKL